MGSEHSKILWSLDEVKKIRGASTDEDGRRLFWSWGKGNCIFVDKYGKLDGLLGMIQGKDTKILYYTYINTITGFIEIFTLVNKDFEHILTNGYSATYNIDGSIYSISAPQGNIC
ncbi:hypothetical protein [Candidatus Endomicrobiellum trichonymphae]|uniref:hypothetical protein n=1 Tax=Endomicrobium trichonymphae TaxID=1408204 RepID=UPI000BAA832F|nr:hypothetical protein [Candidatus Endomicrobium trichonymphae]